MLIDDTEIVKRLHDPKQCREAFTEIIKTYSCLLYTSDAADE